MDRELLRCDICGGSIEVQAGGKKGICENCGASYSLERMREIYSGMKVSVTGTEEDVEQWKRLVETYLKNLDFIAAENVVKKILEAVPSDEYANKVYVLLQEWKYLEIRNGTLTKYNGRADNLVLPEGVRVIGISAFRESGIRRITLSDTLTAIEGKAFEGCENLREIMMSQNLVQIGNSAFRGCRSLKDIIIPRSVVQIGENAFEDCAALESIDISNVKKPGYGCFSRCKSLSKVVLSKDMVSISGFMFAGTDIVEIDIPLGVKNIGCGAFEFCQSLRRVHLPDGLESIDQNAFSVCQSLEQVTIPSTVKVIKADAFSGCSKLTELNISQTLLLKLYSEFCTSDTNDRARLPLNGTPFWDNYIELKRRENRRNRNSCQYCGGEFKGLFTKVCSKCGKPKDY